MKKILNFSLLSIFVFIVSLTTVSAKQLSINELGNSLGQDINYAYIIGDYVFAEKNLTSSQLMLAARSIDLENVDESNYEDALKKMYVATIAREINDETGDPTNNWIVTDNLFGDYTLPKNVDIKYVDGEIQPEDSQLSISLDTSKYNSQLSNLGFTTNSEFSKNLVFDSKKPYLLKGVMLKRNFTGGTFTDANKTGYYFAFVVSVPEANSNTVITISGDKTYKATSENFDTSNDMVVLWALDPSSTNKKIVINVDVDGNGNKYNNKEYVIDYSNLIFQEESNLSLSTDLSSKEVFDLKNEGYIFPKFDTKYAYSLNDDLKLTGKVNEQNYKNEDGYYFAFNIIPEKVVTGMQIKVDNKTLQYSDFTYSGSETANRITFVYKLNENCSGDNCKIDVSIDYDGDEENYGTSSYTITYPNLKFFSRNTVTYKDLNSETFETQEVYEGETPIKIEKVPTAENLTFKYWTLDSNLEEEYKFNTPLAKNQDLTLLAHWDINDFDEYVYPNITNVDGKLSITKNEKNISVKVLLPELKVLEITNLDSIISNLLNKKEITSVEVSVGSSSKKLTDKNNETIKNELTTLFSNAGVTTFDDLIDSEKQIKIKISNDISDVYQNVSAEFVYTFTCDYKIAKNVEDLNNALSNSNVKIIYVKNKINTSKAIEISRDVTIKSLNETQEIAFNTSYDDNEEHKDDGLQNPDNMPAVIVSSGNVNVENLIISGGTTAIRVEEGAIVTASEVTALDSEDAGFDVNEGATFKVPNGANIYYKETSDDNKLVDKESYHYPTICGKGTVSVANISSIDNYKRIVRSKTYEWKETDFRDPETGEYYDVFLNKKSPDEKKLDENYSSLIGETSNNHTDYLLDTGHKHYYLNSENTEVYTILFRDSRTNLIIYKYFGKSDKIILPQDNTYNTSKVTNGIHFFIKAYIEKKDGKTYVHDGWTRNSDGINGDKVDVALPSDSNIKESYYTRFVEGHRLRIYYKDADGKEKIAVFGIVKPNEEEKVKIKDLMDETSKYYDADFKTAWDAINNQKETEEGKDIYNTVIDCNDQEPVTEETVIDENMDLKITTSTKLSSVMFNGEKVVNGVMNENSLNSNKMTITVSSDAFEPGVSTINVISPNNEKTEVNVDSQNVEIELKAITSSMLNNGAKKEYKIIADADGKGTEYGATIYTLDYSNLKLAEEKVNQAAIKTNNASSLTVKNNGYFKEIHRIFEKKYDRKSNTSLHIDNSSDLVGDMEGTKITYTINPDNHKYYSYEEYRKLAKRSDAYTISLDKDCGVTEPIKVNENYLAEDNNYYLNNYRYVKTAYHNYEMTVGELYLLTDVISDSKVEAISAVKSYEKKDNEDIYKVAINPYRLSVWLDSEYNAYKETNKSPSEDENENNVIDKDIVLTVHINEEGYITKIYSEEPFTFKRVNDNYEYKNNKFDLTFSDFETTIVPDPLTQLKTTQKEYDAFINAVKNRNK